MRRKFESRAEVDAYLAHNRIQCLECGKTFEFLGAHLKRVHGMDADGYRDAWGLPAGTPLAGLSYRAWHAAKIRRMQDDGSLDYSHLPAASEAARNARRTPKTELDARAQSERVAARRPGDAKRLPDGALRSDGRNAARAREYQRARRAQLAGDETLMITYREKWNAQPPQP